MYFVNFANYNLVAVNAKSLTAAKRAASRNCPFIGQTVRVFEGADKKTATLIAIKRADPINMNITGSWESA